MHEIFNAIQNCPDEIDKILISPNTMMRLQENQTYLPTFGGPGGYQAVYFCTAKGSILIEVDEKLEESYKIIPKMTAFSLLLGKHNED